MRSTFDRTFGDFEKVMASFRLAEAQKTAAKSDVAASEARVSVK